VTRCADRGYRLLAARSLRKQFKQLAEHLNGARLGEDVESIHRARVASRRLRAALSMFRSFWKRKEVKAWKKQIRCLASNLGEARDHDVLIEFLVSSLTGVSDRLLVPGITCLLNHVERERLWIQPLVIKAIDRFEKQGPLKEMQAGIYGLLEDPKDGELASSNVARQHAGKSIRKRLVALQEEAAGLASPDEHERHHAMRIAAKRLRYTMELSKPVFSSELAKITDSVKHLQTLLGEIHDCDVWVGTFTEFARKEAGEIQLHFGNSRRFERLRPGLDYLCHEREERRGQVFGELVTYWQELNNQGTCDRLATILEWGNAPANSAEKLRNSHPSAAAQSPELFR
jgi:CHAD domain-containing protein